MEQKDVVIIGGGPAGLAAAVELHKQGIRNMIILEREAMLGGILRQCIHDGFGLGRFGESLSGPEYAQAFIDEVNKREIPYETSATVLSLTEDRVVTASTRSGLRQYQAKAVVLAMGCKERSRGALGIPGERPAGVFTAGTAQAYMNLYNRMPGKEVVILGSGDIGMIMARRMTLEGAKVLACVEVMPYFGGLTRNIVQCLHDFNIPLHLSTTVTKVFGVKRVEAVEVCQVDEKMQPIESTARIIPCDALILSVGLLPENEVAQMLGVKLDPATKGAVVDQTLMTNVPGVFSCGNALHVNDLVDYVSLSGDQAGESAAEYCKGDKNAADRVPVEYDRAKFLYVVPQYYDKAAKDGMTMYFRPRSEFKKQSVTVASGSDALINKKFANLSSSEMEVLKSENISDRITDKITVSMEDMK